MLEAQGRMEKEAAMADVAIPIVHLASLQGIRLDISKKQVQDLPAIEVDGPSLSS